MRVAMVLPVDANGPWRSIENYARNLAIGMPAIDVTMTTASSFPTWSGKLHSAPSLRDQVRDADIVHLAHHTLTPLAAELGRPTVVTVHDFIPQMFHTGRFRGRLWAWRLNRQLRDLHRVAGIVAVSLRTREDTHRRLEIPLTRINPVPVAIHPGFYEPAEPVPPAGAPPFLLSIGDAWSHKGLGVLLAALAHPDLRDILLVRVGSPLTKQQRAFAETLGVIGRIREVGRVPFIELRQLFASAFALVQPSLYEGFGMPVAEAFAAGVPVVCSDGGALAEVAADAALVVPLLGADVRSLPPPDEHVQRFVAALARLAREPGLREELTARGQRRAVGFHPDVVGPLMLEVYRSVLGGLPA